MGIRRRRSKVVDVSSFLLFEATGDSESGCSSDPAMVDISHDDDGDDDDAESCSCDIAPDVVHGVGEVGGSLKNKFANVVEGVNDEDDDDDDDGVVEQKEVQLYKKSCRDDQRIKGVGVGKEKKSSSSAENSNSSETMNEMEKNRLFWETCLAS
ncbi:hypothetical protein ERO13_A08G116000v2 [Gossypium hirsutum]|uniref:Uncharacterized protein n=6 Tax=Gossypium TaxID=3633 RepID=A0ABR0P1G1_GOSAR|nr:uncharacterized protein LOC107947889 [Gossypium hirsutum]XP_052874189.1 uncharacterized protein LOC108469034 [Gossypium arboreum]KAB2069959.1 hypothetical protein ES319_A08G125900v1 [Gossypium barbadense]TYH06201.1 hypothetical protein ES288_A08G137600v1 [Gossypium darwinii]TYI14688.1 hypothetical protein ES332_A08G137300v1 [Gossypium tomentosum]TYJ22526.1 hypothetical protein E1A91_A08G131300v1 [Gossypium mustelinum]KAG4187671.1 hypothetical protein ERO13_A08G116000v2 [Gossypium hirsutum]